MNTTYLTGTNLGGYSFEEIIGGSGPTVVYKGTRDSDRQSVVLKAHVIEPSTQAQETARFLREIQLLRQLDHPHIPRLLDILDEPPHKIVVFRLIPGVSLGQVLVEETLIDVNRAAWLGLQIASALSCAHQLGIIHRDIKPDNILLRTLPNGVEKAYLTDFGLAKHQHEIEGITAFGEIPGSPSYLAPEQARGLPGQPESDQYALGVTFYRALSGTLPYEKTHPLDILAAQISEPIPDLALRAPEIPTPLVEIIHRCLQKEPEDRFPDTRTLGKALKSLVQHPHREPVSEEP